MRLRVMLILNLIIVSTLACNLANSDDATLTPTADNSVGVTQPTVTPLPNPDLPPMQTYQDEIYGYSLDYPEGWTIIGGGNMTLTLFSYDPDNLTGRESGVPEGETKLDVMVMPHQSDVTLDTMVERYISDTTVLAMLDITLSDGIPARILRTKSNTFGTEGNLFLAIVGDLDVVAGGLGDSVIFAAIVATIH